MSMDDCEDGWGRTEKADQRRHLEDEFKREWEMCTARPRKNNVLNEKKRTVLLVTNENTKARKEQSTAGWFIKPYRGA